MDLIWTQYGAPADAALASAIERAQAHDPLAAVHVIAPNRYAALAARHTLARRPRGLINVRCEPLSALAGLLGAPALIAAGKRPLSTARLTAELRRTLRRQPATPATLRAYRRAYTELRNGTPTDLERIAAVSPHAARAVAVFQAVRAVVVERTFDDVDLLEQAAIQIDAHPPSDLGTILWWLPGTTTRAERNLVRALAAALPFVTVSATTGEPDADTATRTSLAAVYGSLPSTEPPETACVPEGSRVVAPETGSAVAPGTGSAVAPGTGSAVAPPMPTPPTLTMHRAPDAETEVRAALRTVIARAMHGAPLHTHAIVARDIDPYLPIVHEQAAASTIAIAGPATRRLHDTVIGRFLVSSMRLEADAIHRDEFIAWCSDAPVRNPHDQTRVRAARWDYLTRKAGLISGPSMRVQLEAWQAEQRSKLAKCTSAQSRQAQAIASELADAEILQPFLDGLVEFLEDRAPRAWSAWSDALRAFLTKYLGTPNHRRTWPTAELDAGDDVERILDVLAELDGDTDWLTYCAALLAELDQPAGPVGRYGTGVFVGRIGDLTGTTFEHVTILGVNDGVMPRLRRSDPLLSDEARRAGALPTYDDQRGDERRAFLAALHSGTRTVCSFATTDMRRARPVLPSRWLVHWASVQLRAPLGASALATCAPTPWLTIDTSFVTGLNATPALHPTDALLQTWLAHGPGHVLPDSLRASWDAANQRREGFTAFEGNIGDDLDTAPSGSISPTAFETWARCGRNYFFSRILELDELQRPEALDGIRADDRGSLVHAVLDQFIAEARPRRTPDDAWDDDDHALLDSIFDAECARMVLAGRTGRAVHWDVTSRRLRRVAHRFLEHDNHVRAEHGVVPFATELRFGFADSELPPVVMADTSMTSPSLPSLPAMRGVIDRVDRSPDGTRATVYDYKTGAATSYKDITADDPTAGGTRFQLPAYAMAAAHATSAREIAAAYWFVSDRARPELVTLPINETTLATVVTEWRSITDAIARGLFPAVPGKPSFGTFEHCAMCSFSEICPTDRDRTWEQVALDPLLAHHPALRSSAGDATTSTDGGDEA